MNKIEVDLNLCEKEGISPTAYCFLYLLYIEDERAFTSFYPSNGLIDDLHKRGFIDYKEAIELTRVGLVLFEPNSPEENFNELWNLFPRSVPNGKGGVRILRSEGLDSRDAEICRIKYLAIIRGKPRLHNNIIKCLTKQIEMNDDNLMFMNNLQTWLNQRVYERYEGLDEVKDYGESI